MKARVIKEWEMHGITHKVGEIMNIPLHSPSGLPMISDRDAFLLENGFIDEIKEPLIKDEKIRKAVRAWAEANDITEINVSSSGYELWGGIDDWCIHFGGNPFKNIKPLKYTIDELCGEDEND